MAFETSPATAPARRRVAVGTMRLGEFWKIIDACRMSDEPAVALRKKLARATPDELLAFDEIFAAKMDEACRWDLWGAAYLIEGGCSDDGFACFRRRLIAEGRAVFERALRDPDTLATIEVTEQEDLAQVAADLYREHTGTGMPRHGTERSFPPGKRWNFDDRRRMFARLPRLARRVGVPAFDLFANEGYQRAEANDLPGANDQYRLALGQLPPNDPYEMIPIMHGTLAVNEAGVGAFGTARRHFATAIRLRRNVRTPRLRVLMANLLAWFLYKHGKSTELIDAERYARDGVRIGLRVPARQRSSWMKSRMIELLDTEIRILFKLGREREARQMAACAATIQPRHRDRRATSSRPGRAS